MMKKSLYVLFAGAAMLGIGSELYAWNTPSTSPTLKMITEAEAVLKTKNADNVIAAFENVLKQQDLAVSDRAEIYCKIAEVLLSQRKPRLEEATTYFGMIQKLSDLKPSEQLKYFNAVASSSFNSNFPSYSVGGIVYSENGIKNALAVYQLALKTINGLSNAEKIMLSKNIANCYLELMDIDTANAELEKQVKIPNLSDNELLTALANQADAFNRQYDMDKAVPIYKMILEKYPNLPVHERRKFISHVVKYVKDKEGVEKAKTIARQYDEGGMHLYFGDQKAIENFSGKIQAAEDKFAKADEKNKIRAFYELLAVIDRSGNNGKYEEVWKKHINDMIKINRDEIMKQCEKSCKDILAGWKHQNPQKVLWLMKIYAQVIPNSIPRLSAQAKQHEACGMYPEYIADLKTLLKNKDQLSEKQKIEYDCTLALLTSKNEKAVAAKIVESCKNAADTELHSQEYIANQLKNYARYAMRISDYKKARVLWDVREKMLVKYEKPSLKVPFIKDGPRDISEFLASDRLKDPKNIGVLNRKFGDKLQFLLETDSATTGRVVTQQDGKNQNFTTFTATCDEQGVRLFIMMPVTPEYIKNMKYGYGYLGGFETYLSTGYDQPYTCMLIDCPPNTGVYDDFVTMYDNPLYRRLMKENKNISYEFGVKNNQLLLLITIDWCAVMNGIPTDGFKWEFEPIHWEKGGLSWGGSESVHNRSSYGDLIFENMTKENVTMIKRRLLSFAKKAYNQENSSKGGLLEHWQDSELGDVEFNEEVIMPFKEKYNKYANAINVNMSDEEVNRVFDEAYYTLINTKFIVEALRRDYLERKWVKEK